MLAGGNGYTRRVVSVEIEPKQLELCKVVWLTADLTEVDEDDKYYKFEEKEALGLKVSRQI